MRIVLAALALVALTATAPVRRSAAPFAAAVATAEGGFRLGRADAPVQLVEYASLVCSHCRAFHSDGWASLKRDYVAKGLVAVEVRNMVLNAPDVVASLLARCDGPNRFFARVDAFYDQQPTWLAGFGTITQQQIDQVGRLPPAQQFVAMGRLGHLDTFAAKLGIAPARYVACLADKAGADRLDALEKQANSQGVTRTPTFFLNGTKLPVSSWAGVEASIRETLKMKPEG